MSIHDYLDQHLKQQWNMVRLKTLVGTPFLQGIGDELEALVNKQFSLKELQVGYLEAKSIPNITKNDDIVAAFIFNMSHPV
ncbi:MULTISPECIES: hypothetical protein [unclassified Paenibacillus]|uniref:hypothetical protein n=1 Tax=unclassified Paenibacillus TaxID=185978 RepID=UPI0009A708F5|nr:MULTISPECIES: hypothetical protein [unclassified Paenibacillus]SLK15780.1 hypothetical protein SAMN06272722_1105 [Paenibacillus sp. RU5A]SOC74066.1 hypothetical protein SAMN05880581_1105 [Paenibacillus sp. RU26A]SOC76241.1 hypothetical protein SAMN05880586_1105 [Paenibacillus sp. RU5M]